MTSFPWPERLTPEVRAHSRYPMDVASVVLQYLVRPGDDQRGYEVSMTVQTVSFL